MHHVHETTRVSIADRCIQGGRGVVKLVDS
jgi:hypothetical protein